MTASSRVARASGLAVLSFLLVLTLGCRVLAGFGPAQGGGGGGGGGASKWSESPATQDVDFDGWFGVGVAGLNSPEGQDLELAGDGASSNVRLGADLDCDGRDILAAGNLNTDGDVNADGTVFSDHVDVNVDIRLNGSNIFVGHDESGSPEGVVTGARGSLYLDNTSSTDCIWIKTGSGNTGWRKVTWSQWQAAQDANSQNLTNVQTFSTKGNVTLGDSGSDTVTVTGVLYATRSITTITDNQTGTDDTFYRGQVYLFAGVSGAKTWDLSDAAVGSTATWVVDDTDGWTIYAAAGDTVRVSGTVTATGGGISSTAVGSTVTLVKVASDEWIATSAAGTWSTVAAP